MEIATDAKERKNNWRHPGRGTSASAEDASPNADGDSEDGP
jgi:hypothetical protein